LDDGDDVSGVGDWSEVGQGDAMYDLATLTLAREEHLDDVMAGWIMRCWARAPRLVGPPGAAQFLHHLIEAFAYDIRVSRNWCPRWWRLNKISFSKPQIGC
jgi:hypothetical protein